MQAQYSLFVLATLLQTKGIGSAVSSFLVLTSYITFYFLVEIDESILDAFGILPQRKQHKKLLLVSLCHYPVINIVLLDHLL